MLQEKGKRGCLSVQISVRRREWRRRRKFKALLDRRQKCRDGRLCILKRPFRWRKVKLRRSARQVLSMSIRASDERVGGDRGKVGGWLGVGSKVHKRTIQLDLTDSVVFEQFFLLFCNRWRQRHIGCVRLRRWGKGNMHWQGFHSFGWCPILQSPSRTLRVRSPCFCSPFCWGES